MGASDTLEKPFTKAELLAKVVELLGVSGGVSAAQS
jgi:DNA-binding response OmpR family regulator